MLPIRKTSDDLDVTWLHNLFFIELKESDKEIKDGFSYTEKELEKLFNERVKKSVIDRPNHLDTVPLTNEDRKQLTDMLHEFPRFTLFRDRLYLCPYSSTGTHLYYSLSEDIVEDYTIVKVEDDIQTGTYILPYYSPTRLEYKYTYYRNKSRYNKYTHTLIVTEVFKDRVGDTVVYLVDLIAGHEVECINNFIQARSRDVIFEED